MAAIKSGRQEELTCPISTGAHIATVCQLGNIAFRSQQKIVWDKTKEKMTDEKLNAQYINAHYYNNYTLPEI